MRGIGVDATDAHRPGIKMFGERKVALVAMDAGPGPANDVREDATDSRPSRPGVNRLDVSRMFDVDRNIFANLVSIQGNLSKQFLKRVLCTCISMAACLSI